MFLAPAKMGCYRLLTKASCKRGAKFLHHQLPTAESALHLGSTPALLAGQTSVQSTGQDALQVRELAPSQSCPQRSQQEGITRGDLRGTIQRQQW